MAQGGTTHPTLEATAMATAGAVERIDELDSIIDLMTTEAEDEPDEDSSNDHS